MFLVKGQVLIKEDMWTFVEKQKYLQIAQKTPNL